MVKILLNEFTLQRILIRDSLFIQKRENKII